MSVNFSEIQRRLGSFVLVFVWGMFPAFLLYLLFLQLPVISRTRLGLTGLLAVFLAWVAWRAFPRWKSFSGKTWLLLLLSSGVLALFAKDALMLYPGKAYLFYGQHTLTLSVHAVEGQSVELRGFQTGLGDVKYASFQGLEGWERRDNAFVPTAYPPAPLTWQGWTGDQARVFLAGEPGVSATLSWDDEVQEVALSQLGEDPLELSQIFLIPLWGSLSLFAVMWGAILYGMAFAFLFERESVSALSVSEKKWTQIVILLLSIFLLTGLILQIYVPIRIGVVSPDRDSGVFLYAGQQILKGSIPYRDVWDHKGPLILYLNALGLALAGGSAWGVWALELVWGLASVLLLFFLLREVLGVLPAVVGCFVFASGLSQALSGGNFSEEYALLFQILTLGAFWLFLRSSQKRWLILAGGLVGLSFLLRPNLISLGVGLGLYFIGKTILERFSYSSLRQGVTLLAGFLAPIMVAILFFAFQHALGDFIGAVFSFNRLYVGEPRYDILQNFKQGLYSFPALGFWLVAGSASLVPVLTEGKRESLQFRLWLVLGIAWIADLFLCNLSGETFSHYFLTWLPYAAFLSALFVQFLLRGLSRLLESWKSVGQVAFSVIVIVSLSSSIFQTLGQVSRESSRAGETITRVLDSPENPTRALSPYLARDKSLLVWGAEASINFLLDVKAPTRFVYQTPLMYPAYASGALLAEFTGDIEKSMPVIVDTSASNKAVIPLEKTRRDAILSTPEGRQRFGHLQPFFDFFDAHYRQAVLLSYKDWIVFLPIK